MKDLPPTHLLNDSFQTVLKHHPNLSVEESFKHGAALAATTIYKALEIDKLIGMAAIAAILVEATAGMSKIKEPHDIH
jgi:hypothetical protein